MSTGTAMSVTLPIINFRRFLTIMLMTATTFETKGQNEFFLSRKCLLVSSSYSSDPTCIDGFLARAPPSRRCFCCGSYSEGPKRRGIVVFFLSFFEVSETHQQSSLCQSDRSTTHCRVLSMHPKYIYTVHACHYSSYTTLQVLLWMCARMYICVAAHFEQVIRNSGSAPRCCRRRRF